MTWTKATWKRREEVIMGYHSLRICNKHVDSYDNI
jgi:hypothetical protein